MAARSMRRAAAFFASVSIVLASTLARADAVVVAPVRCAALPWSEAAWIDLLRAELATDGIDIRVGDDGSASLDPATCDAMATRATISFRAGERHASRVLDLADVEPVARARVLAIAMADVIRAGLALPPLSPPPPAAPAKVDAVRVDVSLRLEAPPPPPPPSPFALFVHAETRAFAHGGAGLLGARAGARVALTRETLLGLHAGIFGGRAHDLLGDIDATVATAGATLLLTGGTRDMTLGIGPTLDMGAGWFVAHALAPTTVATRARAPLAFVALTGEASFRLASAWSGMFGVDAGTTLYGFDARADERHAADFTGPWIGVRIGLVWAARVPGKIP